MMICNVITPSAPNPLGGRLPRCPPPLAVAQTRSVAVEDVEAVDHVAVGDMTSANKCSTFNLLAAKTACCTACRQAQCCR